MKIVKAENGGRSAAAFALLLAAVFAPILLRPGSLPGVPDWAGAAVSALCLLGGLWKLAQAGRVNKLGNPPALPGDSQGLTFASVELMFDMAIEIVTR